MSINLKSIVMALLGTCLLISTAAFANAGEAQILIVLDKQHGVITVKAECVEDCDFGRQLSFVESYADAGNLDGRISDLEIFDEFGKELRGKRFGGGVYFLDAPAKRFWYNVKAPFPIPMIAAPHVSWFREDRALIKLYDLLPFIKTDRFRVRFEIPAGWSMSSRFQTSGTNTYDLSSIEDAVFLAAARPRNSVESVSGYELSSSILGEWQFEDAQLHTMPAEILDEYTGLFGKNTYQRIQLNLLDFPGEMEIDRWRAETQAGTITIVSSQTPYVNLGPQRLHEQLRHELFHLWIPGSLRLQGDYGWFYEGFARYQSLKTGVWTGRITFEDFLRSMSESISIAASDDSGMSLIELSSDSWNRNPGTAAAKGMSIAFLCDALLLSDSKGKRNVSDLLKSFIINNSNGDGTKNANEAVISELERSAVLSQIAANHVSGKKAIEWEEALVQLGIVYTVRNRRSVLTVADKPNGRQRALLDKLGYNRWKKFASRR